MQVHKTGDLSFIIEKKRRYSTKLKAGWETLYNQWLERFGMGAEFKNYLELLKKIVELRAEIAEERDAVKILDLKSFEAELAGMHQGTDDKADFYESVGALEDQLNGTPINPKVVTVAEYYGKIKYVEKKVKAQTKNAKAA